MPRLAVLLPVRNEAVRVARALRSLQAQTFEDFEVHVLDDGSTDDSLACVEATVATDARFRIHALSARGLAPTLNEGLSLAEAPLIARMDADDVSHPQRFERQLAQLEACPELSLSATQVRHVGASGTEGFAAWVARNNHWLSSEAIAHHRFVEAPVVHPTVLFWREAVERAGGYCEGDFPEDYELWLRWLGAGLRFGKLAEELLDWHDEPERYSRTAPACRPEAIEALKARYLAAHLRAVGEVRPLWVIGSGRMGKVRAKALEEAGLRVEAFVEIDPRRIGGQAMGRPVLPYESLRGAKAFAISCVGSRGAGVEISNRLKEMGLREFLDFLLMA